MVTKKDHRIQQLERRGRDHEHVDRGDDCHMVAQEAAPSRGGSLRTLREVPADSTYADVKARCARIVTRLEAIATDPNATPADPRDLFIRLELLSYELRGATFRVRECWWPTSNGGGRP